MIPNETLTLPHREAAARSSPNTFVVFSTAEPLLERTQEWTITAGATRATTFVEGTTIATVVDDRITLSSSGDTFTEIQSTIKTLETRVAALEQEVETLKASAQEEAIMLRTIEREQAKQEIRDLFATGRTLYFSDIVQSLRLDISMVIELCRELETEGEVITLGNAT